MLTADRAVESLVEKFASICSDDYSLTTDRSSEIIDYVMGATEKFPEMMGKTSHYVYRTVEALSKLGKKEDGDIFFRAGAIAMHLESNYFRRSPWGVNAFTACLGDDSEAYGLNGKSKSSDRMATLLSRLKKMKQYAGEEEILSELKRRVKRAQWLFDSKKADSQGNFRDVIDAMMLVHLCVQPDVEFVNKQEIKDMSSVLPELFQHVMANDAAKLHQELYRLIEPLVTGNVQGKQNSSSQLLEEEFLKRKRSELIAKHYPEITYSAKHHVSHAEFHQTMVLLSSAVLYLTNINGGKQRFLDNVSDVGKVLLEVIHHLHELYPMEVRKYLLSMNPRSRSEDDLLSGLIPLNEPYQLIEMTQLELNSYRVSWIIIKAAIANQPEHAKRAYEIVRAPFLKLCLHKMMLDQDIHGIQPENTIEEAVFRVLRQPLEGGRQGLAIARYLSGEYTLEEYWEDKDSRGLFNHVNRDRKRINNLISISFLPIDSEPMHRFAILLTHPEWTLDIVSDMYHSYAFSGEQILNTYGDDPQVKREQLLTSLISLNGMTDYTYQSMPQDEYRRILQQNLEYALKQYKKLPTDTRLLTLEVAFEQRSTLPKQQLVAAIQAGLQDASKRASSMALAEFNRVPDQELYMMIYRAEKKASIKEMALTAIRSLDNSKELYTELLQSEKATEWKNLIQILLDTADLSPEYSHAALADLADAKKMSRISWLPLKELPALIRSADGLPLDDRIKQYVLLQSIDHGSGPNERLNELREYVSEASLIRFSKELLQLWIQDGAPAKEKWVMYVSALFGDLQIVHILTPQIKEWTENSRGAIAAEAVKVLAFLKEPAALMAIDKVKRSVKNRQVKGAAEEALQLAAENMGLTAEQLEDRLVTSLGFDEKGTLQLSYGERSFQVKVNADLQVVVVNEETGKAVKSLPAPAQKDDPELAAESKARFTQLKKDLKTMVTIQTARLEEFLSKQRLWTAEEWTSLFVDNVIMQKFAVGLIWGVYEQGELVRTFRYMEDGTFNTVDEDETDLPSGAQVGLVHPLELDQDTLEGWATQLEDYEVKQPFEQLKRQIHLIEDEDRAKTEYDRLPEEEFSPTALPKALEKYGWIKGPAQDGGWFNEFYKEYGEIVAELRFSGTSITYYEGMDDVTLESLHFFKPNGKRQHYYYADNKSIPLGQISGRVFSETLYDILRATGR
ncbi:DUF4132 domain-containing protein [Paenibacillus amylolyticus]|uniref:DUF4132 domain-containing protein n=1 Tax=Paenibacillus amylolyticus TaxID=1451 RepID=A0A5M9WYZ7_PAEAM|nr:DUF4132 domain-containing protein [Paenibacillus amylolyticus]KAA8786762.1 DUF4132 domain-containing protein [Paenibacillus amylolyticus]